MLEDKPNWLDALNDQIGEDKVSIKESCLQDFSHDETEDISKFPDVVVRPENSQDVSIILKIASKYKVPVTPAAARTGLSGGSIPIFGGISLSMERFSKIIEIDESNSQATVEPGVINQVFHDACREKGLFYPPDPSSWGSSTLGGNVAYNAGGPKAVKYGVTSSYILNLEVVLPNGEIIWTGANTLKNSTGYNLTQLFVGSEGTLGVITKIVVRLLPYPMSSYTLLAPFKSSDLACKAVEKIFRSGVIPSGLEFMERDAIDWATKDLEKINITTNKEIKAHLLIEVDGYDDDAVLKEAEKVGSVLEENGAFNVLFAQTSKERDALWKLRRRVGEAVKSQSIYKEEDTVVPRSKLPELLRVVKSVGKEFNFKTVCYGHAGDGNLHVNILKGNMSEEKWNGEHLKTGIRKIFEAVKLMGGTISGEHGIGLVQKIYLDIVFNQIEIQVQKSIKNVFDPLEIMNPGKIFLDKTN
jgi:glycolate oxidase